jgi:hypothetical protein
VFGLLFTRAEAAGEIFAQWRKELGTADKQERLRLAILRKISVENPFAYRVVIGTNPTPEFFREGIKYLMVSRRHTMNASSDLNLNNFLNSYKKSGAYFLAHAILPDHSSEPTLVMKDHIVKRELHVRQAWEIGRDDPDSMGITVDDQPIIPSGKQEAPVVELLRWKRGQKTRRRSEH